MSTKTQSHEPRARDWAEWLLAVAVTGAEPCADPGCHGHGQRSLSSPATQEWAAWVLAIGGDRIWTRGS